MRLQGKAAFITGAARGIGREYALRFAQEGASVAAVDLDLRGAEETAKLIRDAGGKAVAIESDVTSEGRMAEATRLAAEDLGKIDVLVNNAALYGDMDITDQSVEYFTKLMNINILSVVVTSRAVFPHIKAAGGGSIINISSTAAYPLPIPTGGDPQTVPISGYAVSKAAVIHLTKWMAATLGAAKVRVNAIAPGLTMTDATKKIVPGFIMDNITQNTALKRSLEAADLTGTAVYLASDDSALVTGQVIVVDGGLVMLG
jgi:3-oxoacyl-[acyl-carrier protein] reductase